MEALDKLKIYEVPPQIQLKVQIHTVFYLMVDAIGIRFGSELWCHGNTISEVDQLTPLYQGVYSNFEKMTI